MESFCRTCLREIQDSTPSLPLNYEKHKQQLIFYVPEMDLRTLSNTKLCVDCIAALNISYKFKIKCREVENKINKIDIVRTACRTCLKDVTNNFLFSMEKSFYKNKLMMCVPEMNLWVTSDINLCNDCHVELNTIYTFKKKCLDAERRIKEYLKLHNRVDLDDLSVWGNAFVRNEINHFHNIPIKQEVLENEEETTENLEERPTPRFVFVKTEELRICESCLSGREKCECDNKISDNIEHLSNTPTDNFKCLKCEYSTKRKRNLKEHISTHSNYKPYKCVHCKYSTIKKCNLERHIRTHTGEKPFKCSHCEYSAVEKGILKRHIIRRHIDEKSFKCSQCEYSTKRKSNLGKHIAVHTGEKPFKCLYCEYSSSQRSHLIAHIYTHTGEKPFKCLYCEYSAIGRGNLKRHIRTHTGERPYKCSQCEYNAADKSTLDKHFCIHTGEKPYKCSRCEYCAVNKSTLDKHIRTHTGEKPFKCLHCEYSASQKSHLITHICTHTGEKPFKCLYCDFSTVGMTNLKNHVRTHTGEKPYKCLQCEYSATRKSTLGKHIATHTSKSIQRDHP